MYRLSLYLNETNDEVIILDRDDNPILKVTVYDHDGTAWDAGYTATLSVVRSDGDDFILIGSPGDDDNEWYFQLGGFTYTKGNYKGELILVHPADTTPDTTPIYDATPIEDYFDDELIYTFLPISFIVN